MKDRSILIIIAVAVVGMVALGTGFYRVPNSENPYLRNIELRFGGEPSEPGTPAEPNEVSTQGRHQVVEAGAASSVKATISQGAGNLTLDSAAAGPLLDATFDTHPDSWVPAVDYSVLGAQGMLKVEQPDVDALPLGNVSNDWELTMGGPLPVALVVEHGAGEAELALGSMNLESLKYVTGAGDSTLDLADAKAPLSDVPVRFEGGVGELRLVVSQDTPVRVVVEQGVGDIVLDGLTRTDGAWVTDAYRAGQPAYDVRITHGAGQVSVDVRR